MKHYFTNLFLYCFIFISVGLSGQDFYRSNSIGMVFEKISTLRLDSFDWTISIYSKGLSEFRTIYYLGEEVKTFEYIKDGNNLTINEYVSDSIVHTENRNNGLILSEKFFKNDTIEEYIYEWEDRHLSKTSYTENDTLIYEDIFVIDTKGRIKQIRRLYDTGKKYFAGFTYENNVVAAGWYRKNNDFLLYKYSNGKLVESDNWQNDILKNTIKYIYSESGTTVIDTNILNNSIITKIYDSHDRLLLKEERVGNSLKKTVYKYRNNLIIQKNISSPGLRENHSYEYYSDNTLKLEKIIKDNMLFKEKFYENEEKIKEKIYKDGILALIVTYKNGEILDEEYLQ